VSWCVNCECGRPATRRFIGSGHDPQTDRTWGFDWPRCDQCPGADEHEGQPLREIPLDPCARLATAEARIAVLTESCNDYAARWVHGDDHLHRLAALEAELAEARAQLEEVRPLSNAFANERDDLRARLAAAERALEQNRIAYDVLCETNAEQDAKLDAVERERDELRAEHTDTLAERDALQSSFTQVCRELARVEAERDRLRALVADMVAMMSPHMHRPVEQLGGFDDEERDWFHRARAALAATEAGETEAER
jgi:chromosome segregation ATPase